MTYCAAGHEMLVCTEDIYEDDEDWGSKFKAVPGVPDPVLGGPWPRCWCGAVWRSPNENTPGQPPLSNEKDAPKMLTAREERMRVKALNKAVEIVCNDPAVADPDGQRTVTIAGAFLDFLLNGNDPVNECSDGPLSMPPLKGGSDLLSVPPSKGNKGSASTVPPAAEPPRGVVDTAPPAPKKNTGTPKKKKAAKAADKEEQRTSDTAKKFSDWRKQNTQPAAAPVPEEDEELLHDTKHMIDDKGTVPQWVICPKCLTKGIIGTQHNCLKGERVTFSADMPATRAK